MNLGVLSLIVSILALVGVYYNKRQADLTKKQVDLLVGDSHDKKVWAAKHAEARRLVLKTGTWFTPTSGTTFAYNYVFSDSALRSLIETYLIHLDWQNERMTLRALETEQLLLPTVQEVIQQTIDTVEKFKREHAAEAAKLSL